MGDSRFASRYPVIINGRYVMDPSPIPRFDIPKLNRNSSLLLFGAGREKRIYAIPPYTAVEPLIFDDVPFRPENFEGVKCDRCGAENVYFDTVEAGGVELHYCSDTEYCDEMLAKRNKQCC
jgi:alpha-D-ribose 1-methylphosphonate 5-phosphate C-P lyase